MTKAQNSTAGQAVKDLCGVVEKQYRLIEDLRGELEALRDEVEFVKSDVEFLRSDVDDVQAGQAKTNKRRVRNGKAKSVR
jgi:cell division protein FtsB